MSLEAHSFARHELGLNAGVCLRRLGPWWARREVKLVACERCALLYAAAGASIAASASQTGRNQETFLAPPPWRGNALVIVVQTPVSSGPTCGEEWAVHGGRTFCLTSKFALSPADPLRVV